MLNRDSVIQTAMVAFLALSAAPALAADAAQEKCYGLVRAGMNDCATATAKCAGSATQDSQPDAYVFMPAGLCKKLVGGKLQSK